MDLYKIERKAKDVGYDEFVGFIVCAKDITGVYKAVLGKVGDYGCKGFDLAEVTRIGTADIETKEGIVFESFNAG